MTHARALLALVSLGFAAACGHESTPAPNVEQRALPPGVAADVGGELVTTSLIREIAARQGVSAKTAREHAVSDALFAAYARESFRGLGLVESAERSAGARAVLEELRRAAEQKGPASDAEVEEVTRDRWQDLARPELSRTVHAVIVVKAASDETKARALAQTLAADLAGIHDSKQFQERAKHFDAQGMQLSVEELLPVAADGRVADPAQPPGAEPRRFDPAFARAAAAIPAVGEQSPVVESSFGYHVILLLERIPARMLSLDERRALLAEEVVDRRAHSALESLSSELTKKTSVQVDRAADDLLARVQVQR